MRDEVKNYISFVWRRFRRNTLHFHAFACTQFCTQRRKPAFLSDTGRLCYAVIWDYFTVSTVLPEIAPNAALMVALPAATPVATPAGLVMVATVVFDEVQVTLVVMTCVVASL